MCVLESTTSSDNVNVESPKIKVICFIEISNYKLYK